MTETVIKQQLIQNNLDPEKMDIIWDDPIQLKNALIRYTCPICKGIIDIPRNTPITIYMCNKCGVKLIQNRKRLK